MHDHDSLLSDRVFCYENTEQFNLLKNYVNEAREKLVQREEKGLKCGLIKCN